MKKGRIKLLATHVYIYKLSLNDLPCCTALDDQL